VVKFLRDMGLEGIAHIKPAIYKKSLQEDTLIRNGKVDDSANLTIGEIACSLSHQEVLKDFLSTHLPYVLVFEDDVKLSPGIEDRLKEERGQDYTTLMLLKELAESSKRLGWHGLNLGRCWDYCELDEPLMQIGENMNVVKSKRALCTHGYILTREGATMHLENSRKILDAEDRIRLTYPHFRYLATTPRIFDQDASLDSKKHPECRQRVRYD